MTRLYLMGPIDVLRAHGVDRSFDDVIRWPPARCPRAPSTTSVRRDRSATSPNSNIWASRIAGDGIVLIGDAAGAADPTQGHGTSLLFRDVRELASGCSPSTTGRSRSPIRGPRRRYYDVILGYDRWVSRNNYGVGEAADRGRDGHRRAKQDDPTLGGFALIEHLGPDGLVADEAARRRWFGERSTLDGVVDDVADMLTTPESVGLSNPWFGPGARCMSSPRSSKARSPVPSFSRRGAIRSSNWRASACATSKRALPMEPDTIFRIASLTKPIISVGTLMLIEAGEAAPRRPTLEIMSPEFADARVFAGDRTRASQACPARIGRSRSSTCSRTPRESTEKRRTRRSRRLMTISATADTHSRSSCAGSPSNPSCTSQAQAGNTADRTPCWGE